MTTDFATAGTSDRFDADVCIVGSGAAGITLALALARQGRSILVLESGGRDFESSTQELYRAETVGRSHQGIWNGRVRQYGGTTTKWGGQALGLREIDFESRPWVPLSGWPIGFSEIERYLPEAYRALHLGGAKRDPEIWKRGAAPPEFDDQCIRTFLTRWSPNPNFAASRHQELNRHPAIRVLLHANVVEIQAGRDGGTISGIRFSTLEGRTGTASAKQYVLCCGAIETARLLLASRARAANGIGNEHGWVGNCFQDHLVGTVAEVRTTQRQVFADWSCLFYHRGLKYMPKIEPSAGVLRRRGMLNIAGNFVFDSPLTEGAELPKRILRLWRYGRMREIALPDYGAALRSIVSGRRAVYQYVIAGRSYAPKTGRILLEVHTEQAPTRQNRVELSRECDRLGMPKARLVWNAGEMERHTIREFVGLLSEQLTAAGLGHLDPLMDLSSPRAGWDQELRDNNHHIGTTRMSAEAAGGVVDPDCKVFGYGNLFICSSSVFPTSGHSNPTLTIIALALRLADHLAGRAFNPPADPGARSGRRVAAT